MESAQVSNEAVVQEQSQMTEQSENQKKKRGISGSTFKIIAVIAMLIDHFAAVVLARQLMASGYMDAYNSGSYEQMMTWLNDNLVLYYSYDFMRMFGRLGFPIFAFLLVEGFQRTKNVKTYLARMGIFALVSEIPFDLAISGKAFEWGYQNVFFTLLLGLFTLCVFEYFEKTELTKPWNWIVNATGALFPAAYIITGLANLAGVESLGIILLSCGVVCIVFAVVILLCTKKYGSQKVHAICADVSVLMMVMYLADLLRTDYSGMGVLTIVVMYIFRKSKVKAMTAGCVVLLLMSISEIFAFFAIIPAALYNGKRGLKMKYFFYAFYPVHLFLLYLIAYLMGLGSISLL